MNPTYAEATAHNLALAQQAKAFLADYREPGAGVTWLEWLRLCELVTAGLTPADAAEQVQMESARLL